jgi:predicted nuclease of predicted toxin-antitoxin system
MKLLMDENMPREAADLLRNLGHDVKSIRDLNLQGTKNGDIYRLIQAEERMLVTLDLDFANILNYPTQTHPGIIVLRVRVQNPPSIVATLQRFLQQVTPDRLKGNLTIVDEFRYRMRY